MQISLDITGSDLEYLEACARIRDITARSLVRRLLTVIARDQMVACILDDEAIRKRMKGERRYRGR